MGRRRPRAAGDFVTGVEMEQLVFMICMFFGVVSVALIAFTLPWIALGRLSV